MVDGETATLLQKVVMPVVDYQKCLETLSNYAFITLVPSMLCAGVVEGGKDSCQVKKKHMRKFHEITSFTMFCS